MKNLIITIALMLGFAVSAQAQSYNLDFINDDPYGADNTAGERGVLDGTILEFDGVYVQFSATSAVGDGFAYFDSGTAGLGVCGTVDLVSQCDPSNDDNLTFDETLTLSFFSDAQAQNALEVSLGNLIFRNAGHFVIGDEAATLLFGTDGGGLASTSMAGFGWSGTGSSFTFGFDGDSASTGQQYYISGMLVSEVPEPATWLMMIIGFGIVSASTRRSRRASSIAHTC